MDAQDIKALYHNNIVPLRKTGNHKVIFPTSYAQQIQIMTPDLQSACRGACGTIIGSQQMELKKRTINAPLVASLP